MDRPASERGRSARPRAPPPWVTATAPTSFASARRMPSVTSAPPGRLATSSTFTFTAEAGSTTECRVVGPTSTTAWTTCTSPATVNANQGDGTYKLEVRATDASGNLGTVGSSGSYVLDTAAPAAPTANGPA